MTKLRNLFKQFRYRRRGAGTVPSVTQVANLSKTLTMLAQTQTQEMGCDEAYAFLDFYADQVNRGEDAAALMPLVHHHLSMCPDCREELDALLRAIRVESQ